MIQKVCLLLPSAYRYLFCQNKNYTSECSRKSQRPTGIGMSVGIIAMTSTANAYTIQLPATEGYCSDIYSTKKTFFGPIFKHNVGVHNAVPSLPT